MAIWNDGGATLGADAAPRAVWLARHGETDWNRAGRWQGQADPPLNAQGRGQAAQLATRLRGVPVDALYASDLLRARETAELVADAVGMSPRLHPGLREIDIGSWSGKTVEQIRAEHAEELAAVARGEDLRRGGGESIAGFHGRVAEAFHEVLAGHAGEDVLLVVHGGVIRTLVAHVLQAPLSASGRIGACRNAALTRIEYRRGVPRLVAHNDGAHLAGSDALWARETVAQRPD